jgi:essential nuclear protein 1
VPRGGECATTPLGALSIPLPLVRVAWRASGARRTLADLIMEKIAQAEAEGEGEGAAEGAGEEGPRLDPKVVEVYTEVGRYLSHYKSGKLPKVFKLIPGLANWEEITFLTNPETWTPHATYAATRIFASSFNPAKAQRFYNIILLPKCRDDVYFNKRLNFHLYLALKKATYKPAAFYKGIILPLAAAPDCTLKEALIFGSVMGKVSIPQLHSAAALIKLAGMRYTGAVSVLMRVRVCAGGGEMLDL